MQNLQIKRSQRSTSCQVYTKFNNIREKFQFIKYRWRNNVNSLVCFAILDKSVALKLAVFFFFFFFLLAESRLKAAPLFLILLSKYERCFFYMVTGELLYSNLCALFV